MGDLTHWKCKHNADAKDSNIMTIWKLEAVVHNVPEITDQNDMDGLTGHLADLIESTLGGFGTVEQVTWQPLEEDESYNCRHCGRAVEPGTTCFCL